MDGDKKRIQIDPEPNPIAKALTDLSGLEYLLDASIIIAVAETKGFKGREISRRMHSEIVCRIQDCDSSVEKCLDQISDKEAAKLIREIRDYIFGDDAYPKGKHTTKNTGAISGRASLIDEGKIITRLKASKSEYGLYEFAAGAIESCASAIGSLELVMGEGHDMVSGLIDEIRLRAKRIGKEYRVLRDVSSEGNAVFDESFKANKSVLRLFRPISNYRYALFESEMETKASLSKELKELVRAMSTAEEKAEQIEDGRLRAQVLSAVRNIADVAKPPEISIQTLRDIRSRMQSRAAIKT